MLKTIVSSPPSELESKIACRSDPAQTVYGERNLGSDGRLEGKLVRRGSFNPHYDEMLGAVVCFIKGGC